MITEELLLDNGWKKNNYKDILITYEKNINGFFYTLKKPHHYQDDEIEGGNWFDWDLHIDTNDRRSVASMEVDSLEHVDIISQIYRQ